MLRPKREQGFTLVEVMVTVFVVAVGLLAAAALQAVAKKAAVDAMQRTTASVLAQDMLERIRSNSGQVDAYATQGALLTTAPASADCAAVVCTATQLVTYDLARWMDGLQGAAEVIAEDGTNTASGGLRSPMACIRQPDGSNKTTVDIVIVWRGLTALTKDAGTDTSDPTTDTCFKNDAAYADPRGDNSQTFRRVLRLQAHLQT